MKDIIQTTEGKRAKKAVALILLCGCGVFFNMFGSWISAKTGIPLYLDTLGTVPVAVIGGYMPGMATSVISMLLKGAVDPPSIYYSVLNVMIALASSFFADRKWLKKFRGIFGLCILLSVIGGMLGSVLTWILYGFGGESVTSGAAFFFYEKIGMNAQASQFIADYLIDLVDKTISVVFMLILVKILPEKLKEYYRSISTVKAHISEEEQRLANHVKCRGISLRAKLVTLLVLAPLAVAVVTTTISFILYRSTSEDDHRSLGMGVAKLAGSVLDADRMDEYLEKGEAAEGYKEAEQLLYHVRESSPDILYIYVYRIEPDGCHVIFDLDTDDLAGAEPGDVIPFDESFKPLIPKLLAGERIDPLISNDQYGWLLTAYEPIYDSTGKCVAYAATDISVNKLRENEYAFLVRELSLFMGIFILILGVGLWFARNSIVIPINAMAYYVKHFAENIDEASEENVDRIRNLDISTGDEVENLYLAFRKMSEDSMRYVEDIGTQNQKIQQTQNALIMVLADMVESRDKNTGDHVRKTAAYVEIIIEEMKKEGIYSDMLTDEFVSNVIRSAPLHDVGKIQVPDAILNKPGKLTDEEFAIMKGHTTAGSEIMERAIATVPDSDYLYEARNLAEFHHEKWSGGGYPNGLSGDEIPLSARIMAVADVFDALVSTRSYKKGFPFEKAISIIEEGTGTHFDPQVAKAFLNVQDKARIIAEEFGKNE